MGAECSNPTCGRPEPGRCPESSVQAQSCHTPLPPEWSGDCAENRCGEYEFDTSLFFDDHISPPDELLHPAFETMQGNWYRKDDNLHVGEVVGHHIVWHINWKMPSYITELEIVSPRMKESKVPGSTMIQIQVNNFITVGEVRNGPQTAIFWQDGDVWLKK
ncbi:unnamed protein product [Symbiodinium necroappetens]|uniref:Uncharacterized protein n=1 Tax=Symbiodinium necroappetens TaxID=1628268 RepID=A0A812ZXG4_9DINO|nr:unnamed protein product [Symbiodinium necroappetens]